MKVKTSKTSVGNEYKIFIQIKIANRSQKLICRSNQNHWMSSDL